MNETEWYGEENDRIDKQTEEDNAEYEKVEYFKNLQLFADLKKKLKLVNAETDEMLFLDLQTQLKEVEVLLYKAEHRKPTKKEKLQDALQGLDDFFNGNGYTDTDY